MLKQKPSLWRVLAISIPSFRNGLLVIYFAGIVIATVGIILSDRYEIEIKVGLVLLLFFILAVLYARPYKVLNDIFVNGLETTGIIVNIYFWLGMGYITYEYSYLGFKYRSTERIQQPAKAKELNTGQKVISVLDPKNPLLAFIHNLHLNTS